MKLHLVRNVLQGVVSAYLVLSAVNAAYAAADLSDWVGVNSNPSNEVEAGAAQANDYGVTSETSAGGVFQERRTRAAITDPVNPAYLRDETLVGSPVGLPNAFGFNEDFSASGTISFANSNNVDPNGFFGFYNSTTSTLGGTHRLGISMADSSTGFFRMQSNANNGSPGSTVVTNLNTTGTAAPGTPVADGTYPFSFSYVASTRLFSASVGAVFRNITLADTFALSSDVLDRFGFLQTGDQIDANGPTLTTYTLSISDITYSGNTVVGGGNVPGDYNGNGTVDAADYVLWRDGSLLADGTGPGAIPDGVVDGLDYNFWKARFGNSGSAAGASLNSTSIVPEPTAVVLAALAWIVAACVRSGRIAPANQ